jgi:hypothetical protein
MSLTYFLNDLEMVPVAPIITGVTLVFTSHMRCISMVRSLYFKIFSAYYYYYYYYFFCRRRVLPGTSSFRPTAIPTDQASRFRLQYFPYYV